MLKISVWIRKKNIYGNIPDGSEKTPSKKHQDCMNFCQRNWLLWCVSFVDENWLHTIININWIWRSNCISVLRWSSMVSKFIWICWIKTTFCQKDCPFITLPWNISTHFQVKSTIVFSRKKLSAYNLGYKCNAFLCKSTNIFRFLCYQFQNSCPPLKQFLVFENDKRMHLYYCVWRLKIWRCLLQFAQLYSKITSDELKLEIFFNNFLSLKLW